MYLLSVMYWLGATFPVPGGVVTLQAFLGSSCQQRAILQGMVSPRALGNQTQSCCSRRREGAGLHSAMWSRGHLPSSKPVKEKMLITVARDRGVILGELDLARRMLRVGGREGNIQTQ